MGKLKKTFVPFAWGNVAVSFTAGTSGTVNLSSFLSNTQGRTITYSVIGSLPAGVTHSAGVVTYNGSGAAASAPVQFRAVSGPYTSESSPVTVEIVSAPVGDTPPVWVSGVPSTIGPFTTAGGTVSLAQWAFDADGDPIKFYRTGDPSDTAPGSVTVDEDTGVLTIPSGLPASSYAVSVDIRPQTVTALDDWNNRSQGAGVVWAHRFDTADASWFGTRYDDALKQFVFKDDVIGGIHQTLTVDTSVLTPYQSGNQTIFQAVPSEISKTNGYQFKRVAFTSGPLAGEWFTVDEYAVVGALGQFTIWNPGGVLPTSGDTGQIEGSYTTRVPNRGVIPGTPAMRLFCPAGVRPDCVWGRPLAPLVTETATGALAHLSYPADPAANGTIHRVTFQQFFSQSPDQQAKQGKYRGGNFGKAAYQDPAVYPVQQPIQYYLDAGKIEATATRWYQPDHPEFVHSGRFWLQFRIRLSASKLSELERSGKLMWPFERTMSGTDQAAVVLGVRAGGTNNGAHEPVTGGLPDFRMPYMYREQGGFDLEAEMPPFPDELDLLVHQDFPFCRRTSFGSLPDNAPDVCWTFPIDPDTGDSKWVTFMFSFDLGTDSNERNPTTIPPRDTLIQVRVAEQGADAWTTLIDTTTWWWYGGLQKIVGPWDVFVDGDPLDPGYAPRGVNYVRFTLFNGGSDNLPVFFDQWSEIDQIIFSTQEIPLPVV